VQDVKSLYPGDQVVDWIAADPYNFDHNGAWQSLTYEMKTWYEWARREHPDKPLALAEWGSKEDPKDRNHKAEWFRDALNALRGPFHDVKAVVYFDEEKHENGTINDWRIDTSTESLRAFKEMANAKWFDFFVRRGG
jgi:beta-mannanase